MGDNDPSSARVGRDLRQALRDIFVGKTVKAVTPHALGIEAVRDRVMIRQRVMVAMEGCIETCDLRQCGKLTRSDLIGARL